MAKTQSQTGNVAIKKEEEEDCKPSLGLNVRNTRSSSRIAKKKLPVTNNRPLPAQQVKLEEDMDTKSLLKSESSSSNSASRQRISQEQINQLVHYIVKDNMSISEAARKANMSEGSGFIYYKLYKKNPEKKIPLPRNQTSTMYTQEQIGNLIRYINDDKMTLTEASAKADMTYSSAHQYYNRYLKDPNHAIPVQRLKQSYTQDQKEAFIGYIINDKMSIKAASKKARVNNNTGKIYYRNYFKVQNPDIPKPSHIATRKCYTQEQIKEVISYIVDDKMSINAASKKVNMDDQTATRHYRQYLQDNSIEHPVSRRYKHYTQDDINKFIGYIINDKMNITAASKKAKMSQGTAQMYYHRYFKEQNPDIPAPSHIVTPRCFTQEQINEAMGYIISDKISISAASRKANVCHSTTGIHYRQYLKDNNMNIPVAKTRKRYTQDQINELIGYIVDDNMTIAAASKKANMSSETGRRYYHQYLKDRNNGDSIQNVITQEQISELIRYIVDDKMSITAASKKANMSENTARKYYRQHLNGQKRDGST
jgi:transposase